jgi:sec-independent protein translocase protein TatA
MPNIGPVELIVILAIALIVIGPGKLPEVGASLGKSIREFRKAATDVKDSARIDEPAASPQAPIPPTAAGPATTAESKTDSAAS